MKPRTPSPRPMLLALTLAVAALAVPAAFALAVLTPAPAAAAPQPPADTDPATSNPPAALDLDTIDRILAEIARDPDAPSPADPPPAHRGAQPAPPHGASTTAPQDGHYAATGPWPLDTEAAALAAALAEYADTGEPPILGLPTSRVIPHGHQVPVVRCLPLRACDLAFEPGEQLAGWALGDSERWLAEQLTEGRGERAVAHLLLKPTDYELATNLVVITDRRSYRLELESPDAGEVHDPSVDGPLAAYDSQIRWWYPDEWVRRNHALATAAADAGAEAAAHRRRAVSLDQPFDPSDLSFDYRLEQPWRPSRRLPWKPVTVMDDGRQVYLRLPEAARRSDLPVVLGQLDDGSHYPLAARLDGDWLIIPSLFQRAQLILGTGDRQRRLTLVAGREGR